MKKLALLMALLLVLTSCGKQEEKTDSSENQEKEVASVDDSEKSDQKEDSEQDAEIKAEEPVFSDISFDSVKNKKQFKGFTESQINDLSSKGFVVLRPSQKMFTEKYHVPYEMANYSSKPIFITSDAVLNAFNIFYNGSMMEFEVSEFYLTATEMSIRLSSKLLDEYNKAENEAIKSEIAKALAYTYTAARLFFNEIEDIDVGNLQKTEVAGKYYSEQNKFNSLKDQMPSEVMELSDNEFNKVIEAKGIDKSKLFGYDIDYSQFKPRGHYNAGPALRNYFLGQMWLSYGGFEIEGENVESKKVALIIAATMNNDKYIKDLWNKMYDITAYYSSVSDDISFLEMQDIVENILKYDEKKFANLNDETVMKEVDAAIAKLKDAKIKPVTFADSEHDFSTKKQFRFMGQRYNLDQFIFTNLSKPVLKPEVSSFEFFDVLGNEKSNEIAKELLNPYERWDEYADRLQQTKDYYQNNKDELIKEDLYHGYIKAIDLVLNYKPDMENPNVPNYMKQPGYEYLKINTALGSFAQLKHANVLYSKQMMAEMGAPEEVVSPHYLEPNVELYEQLSKMLDEAIIKLEKFGVEFEEANEYYDPEILRSFSKDLKLFVRVAKKELAGENLTDEELLQLGRFGGMCDAMYKDYTWSIKNYGFEIGEPSISKPVISDIATIDSKYLELGIGLPLDIYVLVEQNGEKALAKGVIYSAYEFYSNERLTDETWNDSLLKTGEYGQIEAVKDEINILEIMPYAKEFVNQDENNVEEVFEAEVNWN